MLIRVSHIWDVAHSDPILRYDDRMRHMLEDISLAFALFKLLRRKVEGYYMVEANTPEARHFVLRGLLSLEAEAEGGIGMGEAANAERAFEVVELELRFLNQYYQDIIPMAVPAMLTLFVANFAWSIVFVTLYDITARHTTNNASIIAALASLLKGLVGLFIGMIVHHKCFLHQLASFAIVVRATFDIIITYLLMLILIIVQTYQLVHYVLSDWFVMSLVCHYARGARYVLARKIFCGILRLNHRSGAIIKVNQLNILKLQMLPWVWMLVSNLLKRRLIWLPDAIVTTDSKVAIVRALKEALAYTYPYSGDEYYRFTSGTAALRRQGFCHLQWACDDYRDGVATVIMVWHVATALFETSYRQQKHPLPPYGQAALVSTAALPHSRLEVEEDTRDKKFRAGARTPESC
ncbi:hypothetical protein D1007_49332 [Hordeum vulgare]|nr:hypothetical protein D1007_49332 [Hordeum vulgare]